MWWYWRCICVILTCTLLHNVWAYLPSTARRKRLHTMEISSSTCRRVVPRSLNWKQMISSKRLAVSSSPWISSGLHTSGLLLIISNTPRVWRPAKCYIRSLSNIVYKRHANDKLHSLLHVQRLLNSELIIYYTEFEKGCICALYFTINEQITIRKFGVNLHDLAWEICTPLVQSVSHKHLMYGPIVMLYIMILPSLITLISSRTFTCYVRTAAIR